MFLLMFIFSLWTAVITDTIQPMQVHAASVPTHNCVVNPEYKIQPVLLTDRTQVHSWSANDVERMMAEADDLLWRSSNNTAKGQRFNLANNKCQMSIIEYDISEIRNYTTTTEIMGTVAQQFGLHDPKTKYVIFDQWMTFNCGLGFIEYDDRPTSDNRSNGTGLSIVSCNFGYIVAHEIFHMLGAVQLTAPHSNGHGHCTEDNDIMCYTEHEVRTHMVCPSAAVFDCNNDDYYSLADNVTGYLATHWNVANSPYLTTYYKITLPLIMKAE